MARSPPILWLECFAQDAEAEAAERWWWSGDGIWQTTRHVHLQDMAPLLYQIETQPDARNVTIVRIDPQAAEARLSTKQKEALKEAAQLQGASMPPPISMRSRINYVESGFPFPKEGVVPEGKGKFKGDMLDARVFSGCFKATVVEGGRELQWSDGDVWGRVAIRNQALLVRRRAERQSARIAARVDQAALAKQKALEDPDSEEDYGLSGVVIPQFCQADLCDCVSGTV